uniref:CSON007006 protein n=1 Tax=Culicoides sonorensis TaxID=179676 RepID=A0A336MXM1_CULSO
MKKYYYDKNIMTKVHGKRYAYKFDFHGLMAACQAQAQGTDPTNSMLANAYSKYPTSHTHDFTSALYSPHGHPLQVQHPSITGGNSQASTSSSSGIIPSSSSHQCQSTGNSSNNNNSDRGNNKSSGSILTPTSSYWPYHSSQFDPRPPPSSSF